MLTGHNHAMDAGDRLWQEAAAGVQASVDAELRDEAYEVFVAEAARCRLVDRAGPARVSLRCGLTVEGELVPAGQDAVDEHLVLRQPGAGSGLIPVTAVLAVRGSSPGLRPEGDRPPRSLASWLRESWSAQEQLRLIDASGSRLAGRLDYVGSDHVELVHGGGRTVVPLACVEMWLRG